MAANGKAADDGRVTDLANTVDDRLEEARGFGVFRKWWPGWYYGPPAGNYTTVSTNVSQLTQSWAPVWVPHAVTVDRIGMEITTGGAGPTVTLAIYGSTANDAPGDLILNAGTINPSTNGFKEITISQSLSRGLHWLSFHTTDKITYRTIIGTVFGVPAYQGGAYASQPHNSLRAYSSGLATPSAPAPGSLSGGIYAPLIQVRAS